ncbi:MAG TPA: DEAD/DEAH box helicase [Patescibacteria group bacterium]|nr:DEAD/DEAH box helicase [Patescibacteria group bacterium]
MYNRFNNNRRNGGRSRSGGGSFGGNSFRGGGRSGGFRRIKTFDPSQIVNLPQVTTEVEEYVIKHQFSDFPISDSIKRNVLSKGYKTPTPIQDQAIPPILEGRDLIGMANTGTGKTAAFLIPLIEKVLKDRNQRVLIVTPTRELAAQIRDEFYSFANGLQIYSALCIGGANMWRQKEDLRRNPNFVIGTPGRLEDHIRSHSLNLSNFGSVVLDEADHMVDVGFLPVISNMISMLSPNRQSLFFSATVDAKVAGIMQGFVKNPVTVSVKTGDITTQVKQELVKANQTKSKIDTLHDLLISDGFEKVLIFGRTKHGVQKLSDDLIGRGFKADAIHGNKNQGQRIRILEKFKRNDIQILIATDVASRGLDIPNVSHVINYDLPESYETYIHRIGRTGRGDKKGVALTFVG